MTVVTYEGLRLKVLEVKRKSLAFYRKKLLLGNDFTIISNNCWAGMVYESYNISKMSPTVGLFFIASDYIKFLNRMDEYIKGNLEIVNPCQVNVDNLPQISEDKRFGHYPIGRIKLEDGENILIFFLHYHSGEEALEKWNRRCARVNWNKLIVKFNDQNGCTQEDIDEFLKMPYENKIFFTTRQWLNMNEKFLFIRQHSSQNGVLASYEPILGKKYIDLTSFINHLYLKMEN